MVQFQYGPRGMTLAGVLLLAACGTLPDSEPVPVDKDPEYTDVTKPVSPDMREGSTTDKPAVTGAARSLINKAEVAANTGEYEQALALLERAQRIDPDSGEIYLSLARTYRAKGDYAMASAVAERGMLYCRGSDQCGALRGLID